MTNHVDEPYENQIRKALRPTMSISHVKIKFKMPSLQLTMLKSHMKVKCKKPCYPSCSGMFKSDRESILADLIFPIFAADLDETKTIGILKFHRFSLSLSRPNRLVKLGKSSRPKSESRSLLNIPDNIQDQESSPLEQRGWSPQASNSKIVELILESNSRSVAHTDFISRKTRFSPTRFPQFPQPIWTRQKPSKSPNYVDSHCLCLVQIGW